jgi:hypothetical protein
MALPYDQLLWKCRVLSGSSVFAGRSGIQGFSMRERSKKVTPPIADFLNQLERNRLNFAVADFSVDGWIIPTSDNDGVIRFYSVRTWNANGITVEQCVTALDVENCLDRLQNKVLSSSSVVRHISHNFYQEFFEAVDARRPRSLTPVEAQVCGAARKLDEAMLSYDALVRNRVDETPIRMRAAASKVDSWIKRANWLFAKVEAEATTL